MLKRLIALLFVLLLAPARAHADGLTDVTPAEDGLPRCVFDGVAHSFLLALPETAEGAPLVLMLHGYGGTAESFRLDTGFDRAATARGYAVAFVTGAPDPGDRTSATGWNFGEGSPEKRDTAFLCALADTLVREYGLDGDRVFAVGFSNGAFMAHRLALETDGVFAAVVSVAGTAAESVWENRPGSLHVGLLQITGEKDGVVPRHSDGSARYAKSPAIEDVIAYCAAANGLDKMDSVSIGESSVLTKYSSDGSDRRVWHALITGGRHSWDAERITGVNTNELILSFLDTQ